MEEGISQREVSTPTPSVCMRPSVSQENSPTPSLLRQQTELHIHFGPRTREEQQLSPKQALGDSLAL